MLVQIEWIWQGNKGTLINVAWIGSRRVLFILFEGQSYDG